jgi:plastocyanin
MKNRWLRGVCFGSFLLLAIGGLARCGGGSDSGNGKVTYSISGQVMLTDYGLSGVSMALNGPSTATTTTDASGNYSFTGLDNGAYAITPNRTGFTFSPVSSPKTVSGSNLSAVNFTATADPYSISGKVTLTGAGVSGVTMALSGTHSDNATTDAGGHYIFTGLDNGIYTITPGRTGYSFSPADSLQTVNGANLSAVDFTATPASAQIVTCPSSGTDNVSIQSFFFSPTTLTISRNDIVKWTNNDVTAHTVTSGTTPTPDGKFGSGNLGTGGTTVCVQFFQAGTYPYFCTLHTFMTGSVIVQ